MRSRFALALTAQLIHLTGPDDEAMVRDAVQKFEIQSFVAPFSNRLDLAYVMLISMLRDPAGRVWRNSLTFASRPS